MKTVLYLLRHGATEAELAQPARLQGRKHNPPLARLGVRQAEATRDFLAVRPIDHCYCSPLLRAVQTAAIVAAPHGASPVPLAGLAECDIGLWEGLDWEAVRYLHADQHQRFTADPEADGYPGGETLSDVARRVAPLFDALFVRHPGQSVLVVAHSVVISTYLAGLLGLSARQSRHLSTDACGISIVARSDDSTRVSTFNASFHLQGIGGGLRLAA